MMHTRTQRAFTLIETLVAVSILTLAIVGPLFAANRAIVAARTARDQLTALYLAQEAIEYVRLMRDDAYLARYPSSDASTVAWDDFTNGSGIFSIGSCRTSTCTLDPWLAMGTGGGLSLTPCSGTTCGPLYILNGSYRQQSGGGAVKTPFTRTIQATWLPNDERSIVATVAWTYNGTPYSVSVSDHLTPWQ